jgi:hypothetical protein
MALRLVFVLVLAAVVSAQVPGCPPVPPANGPLADLRVDSDYLAKSWVIKYEEFDNSTCEVKESKGLLTGGPHKVGGALPMPRHLARVPLLGSRP